VTCRSAEYVGLAVAVAAALVSVYVFEPATALLSCLLACTMIAIAVSDARRYIVPDVLSLPAIPAGLLASGWLAPDGSYHQAIIDHTAAALAGAGGLFAVGELYRRIRHRTGLGLGDVKLMAVAGAWTGFEGLLLTLLLACAAALAFVLAAAALSRETIDRTTAIAFGTFLAPSIWAVWAWTQAMGS
jgi:leader peptidase (prepilin peptidase) / N-methyltransferase